MAKENVNEINDQEVTNGNFEEMELKEPWYKKVGEAIGSGVRIAGNGVKKSLPFIGGLIAGGSIVFTAICVTLANKEMASESGSDKGQIESSDNAE